MLRYLLQRLPYPKKDAARIGTADPLLVGRASLVAGGTDEFTPTSTAGGVPVDPTTWSEILAAAGKLGVDPMAVNEAAGLAQG